jgi:hypothetical protein
MQKPNLKKLMQLQPAKHAGLHVTAAGSTDLDDHAGINSTQGGDR